MERGAIIYGVFFGGFFVDKPAEILLWVDKYKPASMKNIVGQHGEKSNAKKLLKWLINWDDNHSGGSKPKGKGGTRIRKQHL